MATETQIAFQGTDAQRELAQAAFEVMRRKGVLFGANTPIKMSCEAIVAALIKPGGPMAGRKADQIKSEIEAALALNADVFAHDGEEFITTKSGHAPATGKSDNLHTFKDRLNAQAQQLDSEGAAQYRASVIDLSATRDEKNFASEDMEEEEEALPPQPHHHAPRSHHYQMPELRSIAANIIAAEDIPPEWLPPPPEPEIEEAEPEIEVELVEEEAETEADAPAVPAPTNPTTPTTPPAPRTTPSETPAVAVPATPQTRTTPAEQQPKPPEATPAAQPQVSVTEQAAQASQAATPAQQAAAPAAPAPAPVPATTLPRRPAAPTPPPAPVITGPVEVMITTSEGEVTIDLVEPVEEILLDERVENVLVAMIEKGLENDARIVRFGADLFPEEGLDRLSKGDHRRIKDYLEEPETGGLASDRDIMADVFNRRTDHPDYERQRFSINYRMLKEKKDFEFVGIDTDRLWVSAGSSPVSLPLRKPAEVGQDYRFLEDATIEGDDETADAAPGPIPYSLTYYEYEQGVLPYDSRFKKAFPGALFEDQRASLIRFEIPALYGAIITELRYPTGNRGGFIMGFRELFSQHMVPGARFSIVPTDRGGDVFEIHFTRTDEREENLLQQDERRGRYVFRPVSFTIETDPELFLIQDKFGKLHNHKKLDESERKRPEVILANTFEAIGEDNGGKLWAAIDDIYAVANIERPISRAWLLQLLSGTTYPAFYPDESVEGAYFYDPEKKGT